MGYWCKRLISDCERAGLTRRRDIAALVEAARQGLLTESMCRLLWLRLQPELELARHFPNVLGPPPNPATWMSQGPPDLELGITENGLPFGLRLDRDPERLLFLGSSGTGKSTAIRQLCLQVIQRRFGVPMVVIDPKGDYPDLSSLPGSPFELFDAARNLRLSGGPSSAVPPNVWIAACAASFASSFNLIAGRVPLQKALSWATAELQSHCGRTDVWPSWQLVKDIFDASPPECWTDKREYWASLQTALDDLIRSSDRLFDCFKGADVHETTRGGRSAVILLNQLQSPATRQFVVDVILLQILLGRICAGLKDSRTQLILVIDEADPFISRSQEERNRGMSPVSQALKMLREFGVTIVLSAAVTETIAPQVLANCSHLYVLNQGSNNALEATKALNLPHTGVHHVTSLRPGECIFTQRLGPWPHAVKGTFHRVEPYRGPLPPLAPCSHVPAQRLADLSHVQAQLLREVDARKPARRSGPATPSSQTEDHGRHLLTLWIQKKWAPVVRLFEQLAQQVGRPFSVGLQSDICRQLEREGLAGFEEIRVSTRMLRLMKPTDDGWRSLGLKPQAFRGRGKIAHQHGAYWVKEDRTQKGFQAEIETLLPGTSYAPDVHSIEDGRLCAYEIIITATDNICSHIASIFQPRAQVDHLVFVAPQQKIIAQVNKAIKSSPDAVSYLNRIQFQLFDTYLKELGHA